MALNNEVSILNIANIDNDIKDACTRGMIAGEEKMEYATHNYDVNQYFIWNDRRLYKTKQPIGVGNNFVVDVNVKYIGDIASQLYDLYSQSPETIRDLISNVEETNNSSRAFTAGEYIIWKDGFLYRVTRSISLGTLWMTTGSDPTIAKVANITKLINDLQTKTDQTRTMIARNETTGKATKTYAVGEQFILNNQLVKATTVINQNAALTLGGNCAAAGSVTSQFSDLLKNLNLQIWLPSNGYDPTTESKKSVFAYSVNPDLKISQGTPPGLSEYATVFGVRTEYTVLLYLDVFGRLASWRTKDSKWYIIRGETTSVVPIRAGASSEYIGITIPDGAKTGHISKIICAGLQPTAVDINIIVSDTTPGFGFFRVTDTTLKNNILNYSSSASAEWTY